MLAKAGPDGDVVLGSDKAPVTIIEYASMTCPHCAHFSETTFPDLQKRYIDTGKVRFIFREFPLDALAAAGFMLARCAGKDKYMPVVETLFAKQREWMVEKPIEPLQRYRQAIRLHRSRPSTHCLTNQKVLDGIQEVRDRAAEKLGVNSTPTFFINGKKFIGDHIDRDDGQGDRPLSQGRIRVFRPPAMLAGPPSGNFGSGAPPENLDNAAALLRSRVATIYSPRRCGTPLQREP